MYPNVPAEDYHALDAASKSRLWMMAEPRTPAHLKEVIDHGQEAKDCFRVGDATHAIILEPQRFADMYVVAGQCEAATNSGKGPRCSFGGKVLLAGAWYCSGHARGLGEGDKSKVVVSAAEFEEFKAMRASVKANRTAYELLTSPGQTELSLVWMEDNIEHAPDGLLMKCRLDRYVRFEDTDVVLDIKTTRDASPTGFQREMYKHGYHVQAAVYLAGLGRVLNRQHTRFIFIAIENTPPYLTAVYEVDNKTLIKGWDTYQRLLEKYAECRQTGNWPGYAEGIQELTLPPWVALEETEQ
jgi:hypothetical protein